MNTDWILPGFIKVSASHYMLGVQNTILGIVLLCRAQVTVGFKIADSRDVIRTNTDMSPVLTDH